MNRPLVILIVAIVATLPASVGRGEEWKSPAVALTKAAKHPFIACTPEELARLRAAWEDSKGAAHGAVVSPVTRADQALARPVEFPPRGGQHNQWYQCDACQAALKTVDDTHHQCPRCKKVYTGPPYDDVVFAHRHQANLKAMFDAAWAWALTGKRPYAEFAAKVLLGYAARYNDYPYHDASNRIGAKAGASGGHLFEQTLNEAGSMTNHIAPAYDLIHDSGVLSDQDRETIRTGLIVPMLRNIEKNRAGKGNWQTWHNAAFIWGGGVLGDEALVRKAVADPANGFAYQMSVSVSAEGMWYENSWGYHFYTLQAMTAIVEGARRLGIDLWHHPTLRNMYTLPVRYTMADGSLPRFGDDVNTTASYSSNLLESAYNALKDPAMGELMPSGATWQSVMFGRTPTPHDRPKIEGSEVFPGAGHAILRTGGEAGLSAAVTFGPYGGFHGHFDKLSFVFFGFGRELGVDPGRAASQAYRLPVHSKWYKATISHNAVLVDAAPQEPAAGRLESFAANDSYAAAVASCDAAYPGVRHRRLVCMTPAYLVVLDDLAADKPRRFDWVYHNRGTAARCAAAEAPGTFGEKYVGQEYAANIKMGETDQPVRIEFAGDKTAVNLLAAAQPKTEVRTGDGVGASVSDRVPLAMITRRGSAARFACILEPVPAGRKPTVADVQADDGPAGIRLTIRRDAGQDTVTVGRDNRVTVTSGDRTVLTPK